MINVKLVELNQRLKEIMSQSKVTDCKLFATLAVGLSVGRSFPIPSQGIRIDLIQDAYSDIQISINEVLSNFNETILIDITLANEIARAYWCTRYTLAHPDLEIMTIACGCGSYLEKQAGIMTYFSQEQQDLINQNSDQLIHAVNAITNALR
jgi:hypothetical protein